MSARGPTFIRADGKQVITYAQHLPVLRDAEVAESERYMADN